MVSLLFLFVLGKYKYSVTALSYLFQLFLLDFAEFKGLQMDFGSEIN
jgi:hypothetical protein